MKLFLKKFIILNVIILAPLFLYPQQQYSVDTKSSQTKRSPGLKYKIAEIKIIFVNWKTTRKKNKAEKKYYADVENYKKRKQTKKVQERMKRSRRKADRYNDNKPRYNFFERIYIIYKSKIKRLKKIIINKSKRKKHN